MKRPEQILQQQIARFLDTAYPALLWFHCPNGGARTKVEAAILKTMGVKAGVPDIIMVLPDGRAAFVELKAGRGTLTEAQMAFKARSQALGCAWAEVRSLDEMIGLAERWLLPFGWVSRVQVAA